MERRKLLRNSVSHESVAGRPGMPPMGFAPISLAVLMLCFLNGVLPTWAATSACVLPPSGLVGWWPGDTDENDIVGKNNPTTVSVVSLVPGEVLNGFSFGTKGLIHIPSSPSLANQTFTWAAWVKPGGPGPNNDVYGSDIVYNNVNDVADSVSLSWSSMTNKFVFIFGNITSASGYITSKDTFPPGSFYFVAGAYDGKVFQLFVNGVLEASSTQTKLIPYSSSGWYIGGGDLFPSFPRTWNGVIDEVQAFNRALSAAELQSIYNAGSSGECKGSAPVITGVVNDASFASGAISIGSWVAIFGTGLAPVGDSRTWNAATEIVGGVLPVSLDGTSVTVNGKPAVVEFIQPTQVNIQPPDDTAVGPVQVVLSSSGGVSNSFTVNYATFAPGFFGATSPYIVAQHADNSYVSTASPAQPGEVIILWGTGFGPASPAVPAGQVVSGARPLANTVTMTIGGQPAVVNFAGVVGAGLVQVNVQVPSSISNGDAAVVATVGGASTQTTANMISVHN